MKCPLCSKRRWHEELLNAGAEWTQIVPGTLFATFCQSRCWSKAFIDHVQCRNKQRPHRHDQCPFKSFLDHRVVHRKNQEIHRASQRWHDKNRTDKGSYHHLPASVSKAHADHHRTYGWLIINDGGIGGEDQAYMPE